MSGASRDALNSPPESVESPSEVLRGSLTASSPFAVPEKQHQPFRNPSGSPNPCTPLPICVDSSFSPSQTQAAVSSSLFARFRYVPRYRRAPQPRLPSPRYPRSRASVCQNNRREKSRAAPQVHPNLTLFRFESCPELLLGFSPLHPPSFFPSLFPPRFGNINYCFLHTFLHSLLLHVLYTRSIFSL